jgi:hypothetical protein
MSARLFLGAGSATGNHATTAPPLTAGAQADGRTSGYGPQDMMPRAQFARVALAGCVLVGCGTDVEGACEDFIEAANACNQDYADANEAMPIVLDNDLCDMDGVKASASEKKAAVDRFECAIDVYESSDCETKDGYAHAEDDAVACQQQLDGGTL